MTEREARALIRKTFGRDVVMEHHPHYPTQAECAAARVALAEHRAAGPGRCPEPVAGDPHYADTVIAWRETMKAHRHRTLELERVAGYFAKCVISTKCGLGLMTRGLGDTWADALDDAVDAAKRSERRSHAGV